MPIANRQISSQKLQALILKLKIKFFKQNDLLLIPDTYLGIFCCGL